MFGNVREALRMLMVHLWLIAPLVLLVSLPGNVLVNYLFHYVPGRSWIWTSMLIGAVFQPVSDGALIYALWEIKSGKSVTCSQPIEAGLDGWGRLFAARVVTGLFIGLGLIFLIVPGVVLALRYALLSEPVIVEEADGVGARKRSTQLTRGVRLQILGAVALCLLWIVVVAFIVGIVEMAAHG